MQPSDKMVTTTEEKLKTKKSDQIQQTRNTQETQEKKISVTLEDLLAFEEGDFKELTTNQNTQKLSDATLSLGKMVDDAKRVVTAKIEEVAKPKEYPKTLKGLVDMAKSLDIDVEKVDFKEFTSKETKSLAEGLVNPNERKTLTQGQPLKQNPTEISTQEMVGVKVSRNEKPQTQQSQTQKKQTQTLQSLLETDTKQRASTGLTNDFSVASAKVSAPKLQTQPTTLASIIQTQDESELDTQEPTELKTNTSSSTKTDAPLKTDSLEVKVNEAKQMVKYLSQDVKTAIENYKAPFTRVKVQLNPQNLGNVELTVVQRGENLHVNLSSNNTAINTLALHANDLKVQLQNNGIQNASLHFNNGSDNGSNAQSNAQQQQNRQHAQQQYKAFDINEEHEELLSSLEIIIPSYA